MKVLRPRVAHDDEVGAAVGDHLDDRLDGVALDGDGVDVGHAGGAGALAGVAQRLLGGRGADHVEGSVFTELALGLPVGLLRVVRADDEQGGLGVGGHRGGPVDGAVRRLRTVGTDGDHWYAPLRVLSSSCPVRLGRPGSRWGSRILQSVSERRVATPHAGLLHRVIGECPR